MPRIAITITAVFVAVNLLLLVIATPDSRFEIDTEDFYSVARALKVHGGFVDLEDPSQPSSFRQPGYPIILFAAERIAGAHFSLLVAVLQIVALFMAGLLTRSIVSDWLPGREDIAFGLLLLNPNTIGSAHTLLPMTLYSLAFVAALFAALRFARSPAIRWAVVLGITAGAAMLLRGEIKYLVYLFPLAVPVFAFLGSRARQRMAVTLTGGVIAMVVAVAVASPWMIRNYQVSGSPRISAGGVAELFLVSNISFLEKRIHPNLSLEEARSGIFDRGRQHVENQQDIWASLSTSEQKSNLFRFYLGQITTYPTSTIMAAAASSEINLFVSGGAQNLTRLLGFETIPSHQIYIESGAGDRVFAWFRAIEKGTGAAVVITILSVLFAISARIIGLVGLTVIAARRDWMLLLALVALVIFVVAILMFNGLSRYRLPIEPILAILAAYGADGIARYIKSSRSAGTAIP